MLVCAVAFEGSSITNSAARIGAMNPHASARRWHIMMAPPKRGIVPGPRVKSLSIAQPDEHPLLSAVPSWSGLSQVVVGRARDRPCVAPLLAELDSAKRVLR